jgi:predicted transcriptional regulator
MELSIPPELEEKLKRLAASLRQTPEKLALDLLRESIEYHHWFFEEVAKGRADARAGRLIDHEEVVARINARYPR